MTMPTWTLSINDGVTTHDLETTAPRHDLAAIAASTELAERLVADDVYPDVPTALANMTLATPPVRKGSMPS